MATVVTDRGLGNVIGPLCMSVCQDLRRVFKQHNALQVGKATNLIAFDFAKR